MTTLDYVALALFVCLWYGYSWATGGKPVFSRQSLNQAMVARRRQWIHNALNRELRMIDTQILAGLQNGTAFFASTSIFAIGGCFALLGATDRVDIIFRELPLVDYSGRAAFELKVAGLTAMFAYAFFKFGWAYRLFNYCTILFGALPLTADVAADRPRAEQAAEKVIRMNIIAARNFNAGLRTIFLSIGYLGWFVGPYIFMASTLFVVFVLTRRQFFSDARRALMDTDSTG